MCKFCNGRGCIACPGELEKAKRRALEPIFTARQDNEHDMELLKMFFGRESLESGVVPGVSGPVDDDIGLRGALASLLQHMHNELEEGEESAG